MEELLKKLKAIEGQELKYKKLCEAIGFPVKTSDSKNAQLKNLTMYCDLVQLEKPRRYLIKKVYDKEMDMLGLIDNRNKYQLMFEAAVYQAFLDNGGEPLYLSNMDSIKLFKEVNDNFAYACNKEDMQLMGPEYEFMPDVAKIIYKILRQWTMRRIDSMNTRHTAIKETGYRLYKENIYNGQKYKIGVNVPKDSMLSKRCQAIYSKAIDEIMPQDWGIEHRDREGNLKSGKYWVSDYTWAKFENKIKQLLKEEFNDVYVDLKPIIILKPPTSERIQEKLGELCHKLEALININEEVCKKALTTTQLDHISNKDRKRFVETNMKLKTPISFREELKKRREII